MHRNFGIGTLEDQRGFVDRETGAISLKTFLLPIDGTVPHRDAWRWVAAFERLAAPGARIRALHVGSSMPENVSEFEGTIDVRTGHVVETIVSVAEEIGADIVAMPTAGRHGLFDALRGSVPERVLHEALCPMSAIPVTGAHLPAERNRRLSPRGFFRRDIYSDCF